MSMRNQSKNVEKQHQAVFDLARLLRDKDYILKGSTTISTTLADVTVSKETHRGTNGA